jgi:hypothetical protein
MSEPYDRHGLDNPLFQDGRVLITPNQARLDKMVWPLSAIAAVWVRPARRLEMSVKWVLRAYLGGALLAVGVLLGPAAACIGINSTLGPETPTRMTTVALGLACAFLVLTGAGLGLAIPALRVQHAVCLSRRDGEREHIVLLTPEADYAEQVASALQRSLRQYG